MFQELGGEDSLEEVSGVVEVAPVMTGGHQGARLRHVGRYVVIRLLKSVKISLRFQQIDQD